MSSVTSTNLDGDKSITVDRAPRRYEAVTEEKAGGATYTPKLLADFVAIQMLAVTDLSERTTRIRIMDPAIGNGALLMSLLEQMPKEQLRNVDVFGFETDENALNEATARLRERFPDVNTSFENGSFLAFVLEKTEIAGALFASNEVEPFDLIIANPPYVRTQILGAHQAQLLAKQFGLAGRVDLYHAFLLAMAKVLKPDGTSGIIVSNRFMTTKTGASVRRILRGAFDIHHIWDLGDTKLFEAAVLPAVLIVHGKNGKATRPRFTSIYETTRQASSRAADPIAATTQEGAVEVNDGRRFEVRQGVLDFTGALDCIWRIATDAGDSWLATVQKNTWRTFRDIGKTRVGVKTCADNVFIRDDWQELPFECQPELLRPLITHHVARRFRAASPKKPRQILYPHEVLDGSRIASDLNKNPRTRAYLEGHRDVLEARRYITEGGRKWYEIWVPQNPSAWDSTKLVFRDISEKPTFWIDKQGAVVNGDCYWLVAQRPRDEQLLWLAVAISNSTFAEAFYDHRFHNKLYARRRRFMTQYVEQFPLPDPANEISRTIISMAQSLYEEIDTPQAPVMEAEINRLVWSAFGLPVEEVSR
jgi:adenine-specific DNA-methyltransferase